MSDNVILFECGLCPSCGADSCGVDKTEKPLRKMYCKECNFTWQTLTVNLLEDDALQKVADIYRQKRELEKNFLLFEKLYLDEIRLYLPDAFGEVM